MERNGYDMTRPNGARLGIDVGGTFVDFAFPIPGGDLLTHKVLADPLDLAGSVLKGMDELASLCGQSRRGFLDSLALIVHGTTVGTNAVLTHKGSRVGLLTTAGTRDALEMRRGIKEEPLNNKYQPPPPLVPRYLRLPVVERVDSSGSILTCLDHESLDKALRILEDHRVESIAICLMHSYVNDKHEKAIAARVRESQPEVYVTTSSELMPQLGYYNRVSTTVLNSYVGPLLKSYLSSLSNRLKSAGFEGSLLIMNSAGGVMSPEKISHRAASSLLSGPAAGPIASRLYTEEHKSDNFVVIDMGGTSLDISLASKGEPIVTTEGNISRYAIALPMIDIRTIGAGGGSIAWVDGGGFLHVGPQSAGASPGPACYQLGGQLPTCTDADVLLGYIDPHHFLGGRMKLDRSLAEEAVRTHIAAPLGLDVDEAAIAIFQVINASMAAGIRDMIVDQGLDPRDLPLVVGGGAGPVHAAALATELDITRIIIPRQSGVFCAIGMLFTDLKYDLVRSYSTSTSELDQNRWRALFDSMKRRGFEALITQGARPEDIEITYSTDLRYFHQIHELAVSLTKSQTEQVDIDLLHVLFDRMHDRMFGYCLPHQPLEVVNLRAKCVGKLLRPPGPHAKGTMVNDLSPRSMRQAYIPGRHTFEEIPVYMGEELDGQFAVTGPAIAELPQTTIIVPPNFTMGCDSCGSFVLTKLSERQKEGEISYA